MTKDRDYNTILDNKIDELQVNGRKPSFEIKNVPKTCNENKEDLVGYVANLSGTLDCTILKSDIADIYRRRSSPIIVETKSTLFEEQHSNIR